MTPLENKLLTEKFDSLKATMEEQGAYYLGKEGDITYWYDSIIKEFEALRQLILETL